LQLVFTIALALVVGDRLQAQVTGHPDPLSLLESEDPVLAANKRLVFDLWRGVVNGGHVELADELLVEGYVQHSPVLPTGRTAFKQIFSAVPRLDEIPELVQPPVVAMVAEGPLVVMALAETLPDPDGSGTYTSTHFNLFRVENGRLAEHWHSVQTAPGPDVLAPEAGGPQPVSGATGLDQYVLLTAADAGLAGNKRLVFDAWRQIFDARHEELADIYLDADYVGHTPSATSGRAAFKASIASAGDRPIGLSVRDPLVAVVAEGDLVVQVSMREYPHPSRVGRTYTTTWFDMFRIADGRLAEHWDPGVRTAAAPPCAPDAVLDYICGLSNAEDIVAVGSSRWLIASSITTRGEAVGAGRLYLIDAATRAAVELFPGAEPTLRPNPALYGNCSTIDLESFDTHGLALRSIGTDRYRLYATSHGSREAIQAFELDTSGERPRIAWVGCVPLPADAWANGVVILEDGGFLATRFMDPTDPDAVAGLLRGDPSGAVLEWHPGGSVTVMPGTGLAGPNGIELSADGRFVYVAAFGGREVVRFDRGPDPVTAVTIPVDIVPDNLRWSSRGTLLSIGGRVAPDTGLAIVEIDPAAMSSSPRALIDASAALQSASTALEHDGEIWIGTPGGDRVGILRLP
jgi:predicted SnoaL-like aldol condensation-catalyzing enzyme